LLKLCVVKMRRAIEIGDKVVVVKSWHSDVIPGATGTVVKRMRPSYAVAITACFKDATGKDILDTRQVFFAFKEIRRAQL
jgi:hypothetical protein